MNTDSTPESSPETVPTPPEAPAAEAAPADAPAETEAASADAAAETEAMETAAEAVPEAVPVAEESASEAEIQAAIEEPDGLPELPELEEYADFEKRIEAEMAEEAGAEGQIVTGKVTEVGEDTVSIDIGDDRVGAVDRDQFIGADGVFALEVGHEVEVYVESVSHGIELDKEKADKLRVWERIGALSKGVDELTGTITGRTKGGLTVDIGIKAFLPGSQIELRPAKDLNKYVGQTFEDFKITRFDRRRGNCVVSRRGKLEQEQAGIKVQTLEKLHVGAVLPGVVKNLTDYGCFIDLGGIDGLLHITDMSWARLTHPKQLVKSGQELEVQVLQFDAATEKVKLGLKQLSDDPWEHVDRRYREGQRIEGIVRNLTDFGAFVQMEAGVEGLIHVSELSWTKRIKHPKEVLTKGEEIEAVILAIDNAARRVSLSLKKALPNPWNELRDRLPVGTQLTAKIRSVTNFGVFLGVEEGIDGLVHVSDLSWTNDIKDPQEHYQKGGELTAVVLAIDVSAERLSLGVKQLSKDPWQEVENTYPIGSIVEGPVIKVLDFGAIVQVTELVEAMVHISEIKEERTEDINAELKVGDSVRAKVIAIDAGARKMGLSIARLAEAEIMGEMADFEAQQEAARTTIGDLIREKIDISKLPPGPADE
ncbi:MAG: small subunit ribosomal protein S1 [Myxococcota bacterium]|jgi:small subunit ribosomal protein S1